MLSSKLVTVTEHLRAARIKELEQLVQFPSWEVRMEVLDVILLMAKSHGLSLQTISQRGDGWPTISLAKRASVKILSLRISNSTVHPGISACLSSSARYETVRELIPLSLIVRVPGQQRHSFLKQRCNVQAEGRLTLNGFTVEGSVGCTLDQ